MNAEGSRFGPEVRFLQECGSLLPLCPQVNKIRRARCTPPTRKGVQDARPPKAVARCRTPIKQLTPAAGSHTMPGGAGTVLLLGFAEFKLFPRRFRVSAPSGRTVCAFPVD